MPGIWDLCRSADGRHGRMAECAQRSREGEGQVSGKMSYVAVIQRALYANSFSFPGARILKESEFDQVD